MNSRVVVVIVAVVVAQVIAPAHAVIAEPPMAVSPGMPDRLVTTKNGCPTFSWAGVENAAFHELLVFALPADIPVAEVDLTTAEEVMYASVAGSATSWTPSVENGLPAGGRYVWFVRGIAVDADGDPIEPGDWSSGRFFSVPSRPSGTEVRQALEVLRADLDHSEYSADVGVLKTVLDAAGQRAGVIAAPSGEPAFLKGSRSVPTAVSAIRGEQPDGSGEAYGVVGTSASVDGADIGAANLGGGMDLVLDGSADGATDTAMRESGLYRSSASSESFTIANPGVGDITLQVAGEVDATSFDGQGCQCVCGMTNRRAACFFLD